MPRSGRVLLLGLFALIAGGCCDLKLMLGMPDPRECGHCPPGEVNINGTCFDCDTNPEYCPNRPGNGVQVGVGAGADASPNGGVVLVAGEYTRRPMAIEGGVEIGRASEDGYEIPEASHPDILQRGGGFARDYTVFQTYLRGKYLFPLLDGRARFYPLAGVRYVRYALDDCTDGNGIECSTSGVSLDAGGGLGYGPFSIEAFTGVGGEAPNASVRARAMFPLPFGR